MLTKVKQYIEHNNLISTDKPLLVALSGGRDSVALLSILHKLGCELIVLHCNFHIRKDESDRDEQFVKELCSGFNIPLIIRQFQTNEYSRKYGISIEMAARDLRYQWFEAMRQRLDAQAIAVAHHQDDQAETILLNLIRGTGLRGLCGMRNKSNYIVRPLLCVNRTEIEQYIQENDLKYVDDSTNSDTTYKRNKIRHNILPELKTLNPNIVDTLCRETDTFRRTNMLYDHYVRQDIDKICTTTTDGLEINIEELSRHPLAQEMLYEIIRDYGFNWEQCQLIQNNSDAQSGKRYQSADYEIIKDRNALLLYNRNDIPQKPQLQITRRMLDQNEKYPSAKELTAFFDPKVLNKPLELRHWQYGDTFYPLGMNQCKKLSDYFIDHKISLKRKHQLWLLLSGSDIVWIIRERIDNRYKVTDTTKEIVEITIKQP